MKLIHLFWSQEHRSPLNQFFLTHYLCVQSIIKNEYPCEVWIWTNNPGDNEWWNATISLPNVFVKDASTYTKQIEYKFIQHLSDYVRYRVLYEYGGMIIDFDTLLLKPIMHQLDKHEVFLVPDGINPKYQSACLLSRPESNFLKRCLELSENAVQSEVYTTCGPEVVTKAAKDFEFGKLNVNGIEQSIDIWRNKEINDDLVLLHYCTMMWGYYAYHLSKEYQNTLYHKSVKKVLGKWGDWPDIKREFNLVVPQDVLKRLNTDNYISIKIGKEDTLWELFKFKWKNVYEDPINVIFREWCPDPNFVKPTLYIHCHHSIEANSDNVCSFTNLLVDLSIVDISLPTI